MTAAGRKAMSKMKLRVGSDEQKEHVAIQLVNLDTGKALGAILLDGASAEHHIHEVAKSRAILKGGISPSIDPGFRFDAVLEPSWQGMDHRFPEGRILALRHSGLGWLTFCLSDNSARKLAEWLLTDLPMRQQPKR
jgi:hypothetical protein